MKTSITSFPSFYIIKTDTETFEVKNIIRIRSLSGAFPYVIKFYYMHDYCYVSGQVRFHVVNVARKNAVYPSLKIQDTYITITEADIKPEAFTHLGLLFERKEQFILDRLCIKIREKEIHDAVQTIDSWNSFNLNKILSI